MVSDKIAAKYDDTVLPLGLTYSAHPVCCAAALEMLKIYEDDNLIENAAVMGKYMDEQIEIMMKDHPSIGDWRNQGLLGCLELVKNRETKEPMAPFNACLLYTSDAADERSSVDLGGRRIIKKKKKKT